MLIKLNRDQVLDKNKGVIIELYGTINSGKKLLAQSLSKKIRGSYVGLPSFSIYDLDFEFFKLLKNSPNQLLANPDKWISLYRSFLFNYHDHIQNEAKNGIVVTTNYLRSLRFYSGLSNCNHWNGIHSYPIVGIYCKSDIPFVSDLDFCGRSTFNMWSKVRSLPKVGEDLTFSIDPSKLSLDFEGTLSSLYSTVKRRVKLVNNDYVEEPQKLIKSIQQLI